MKLDPRQRRTSRSCGASPRIEIGFEGAGGSWSTPALYGEVRLLHDGGGPRAGGRPLDRRDPVGTPDRVARDRVAGRRGRDAAAGGLLRPPLRLGRHGPDAPADARWDLDLGDCIESTPAVWHGWLYVGTREGYLYGIADADTPPPTAAA